MQITIYFEGPDPTEFEEFGERDVAFTDYGIRVRNWKASDAYQRIIPWHRVREVKLHGGQLNEVTDLRWEPPQ